MSLPVVIVGQYGIPVTAADNALPVVMARNGYGLPVMPVSSGGLAVTLPHLLDPAGWGTSVNGGTGTASVANGVITVAGDGTLVAQADQQVPLVPGVDYTLSGTVVTNPMFLEIGTSKGDGSIKSGAKSVGAFTTTFTAGATTWIEIAKTSTGNSVVSQLVLSRA